MRGCCEVCTCLNWSWDVEGVCVCEGRARVVRVVVTTTPIIFLSLSFFAFGPHLFRAKMANEAISQYLEELNELRADGYVSEREFKPEEELDTVRKALRAFAFRCVGNVCAC